MLISDIKKKHSSHAITADVSIGETAAAAEYFLTDGVIVTGVATGKMAEMSDIINVKKAVTKVIYSPCDIPCDVVLV